MLTGFYHQNDTCTLNTLECRSD